MKRMLPRTLFCTACIVLAASGAYGGPIQRADVAANPAWVVHLDCDALRSTALGRFVLEQMDKPEAQAKLAAFQAIFSIDLRNQLHGMTLYSTSIAPEDAVLLVYADFSADRLLTMAKAAQDYQASSYKNHAIHSWIDEKATAASGVKKRTYAAIEGSRILFGKSEAAVARAVDVIGGTSRNLAASGAFPQLRAAGGVFVQAVARKLDIPEATPNAAVLRLAKQMSLQVAEVQGQLSTAVSVETEDEETATNMLSVAQGLVSLVKLQKENPELTKWLKSLSLKQEGAGVTAVVTLPVADVVKILQAEVARRAALAEGEGIK
jgi:hypothetical protein